jgi:anti-anti-sigma regulatory factor
MMKVSQGARGELVIRLAGTFDHAAATRVTGQLREAAAYADVVLDFSAVRQLHDHGLAAVADAIGERAPSIAVRGLGRHHERLLRYFGVELQRAVREEA